MRRWICYREISPTGADIFNTEPTWRLLADIKKWWKDRLIPPDAIAWGGIDILSDKERLRIKLSDKAGMYRMPIFKSQAEIFSEKIWANEGVYKYALHNLVKPIGRGKFYM